MRNRLCLHGKNANPIEQMAMPVSEDQRNLERQRLKDHKKAKSVCEKDQIKLDRLHWVIGRFRLEVEPEALKYAERTISKPMNWKPSVKQRRGVGDVLD